ncbi:PAS domain S-box [Chthonomonas calidirosea]|uniref:PAS domain S-box protein n=1 Tax=Chthonomonas calidirosea TaxID=454171 RepID=UPI0006DD3E62|nr:PAS domain S-box protein [Chthonomonas calidirosea]CEK13416.1 PAS domain S-box [Chthonomonas calidirosea]
MPYTLPDTNIFRRRFFSSLAIPLGAEAILIGVLFWNVLALRNAIFWVNHTYQVISSAENLQRDFNEAESAYLHFLLFHSPTSLTAYQAVTVALSRSISSLQREVADNPIQVRRLNTAKTLLADWRHATQTNIAAPTRSAALKAVALHAFRAHQNLDVLLGAFIGEEKRLLTQRLRTYSDNLILMFAIIGLLSLTSITLVFWGFNNLRTLSGNYERSLTLARSQYDQLQKEKEFRDKVLENSVIPIVVIAREGHFSYVNQKAAQLLGYTPEELIGQSFLMTVPPDEAERVQAMFDRTLHEKSSVTDVEVRALRKDGSIRNVVFGWVPLLSENEVIGLVACGIDITEKKRLEQELLAAQKLESLGRLAGGIAHDFNNVLTAIFGYMELASEELPPNHPVQVRLRDTERAAESAAKLTQQLLAFARRQIIQPRLIRLDELVQNIQPMLQRLIGENIELRVKVEQVRLVKVDPGQMEQILVNLAVNARDAMPDGGVLTIGVEDVFIDETYAQRHEEVRPGNYVMLTVSDTGVGMDQSIHQHIFEPFFTTKPQGRGTGLGLATCYGIVKQAGGHIWLYSEPGHGTTFKIFLPHAEGAPEELQPHESTLPPVPKGTETILLAEDEPSVREVAASALRAQGYTVLEAGSGEEAIRLAERHPDPIHLLITDAIMPSMSGRDLAEHLQQTRKVEKVLYISGYTENAIVHQGVLEQGIFFLAKPFTPSSLLRKVREVLDSPA